jgi:hypothetical protein
MHNSFSIKMLLGIEHCIQPFSFPNASAQEPSEFKVWVQTSDMCYLITLSIRTMLKLIKAAS